MAAPARGGSSRVRRLTAQEVERYGLVAADVAQRVRVVRVPALAPGYQAMTLGRFVLMRKDDDHAGQSRLLAHELVHVAQYARLGVARFLGRYLREYAVGLWRLRSHRQAYEAISLEVEARSAARSWAATVLAGDVLL